MIPYEIVRSRRKTISLQVTQEGKVLVRCPRRLPLGQVQRFVLEHENWLEAQLTKIAAQPKLPKLTEDERKALVSQAAQEIPRLAEFYVPWLEFPMAGLPSAASGAGGAAAPGQRI